jgi:hypothetical protein
MPILDWMTDQETKVLWQDVPLFTGVDLKSVEVFTENKFARECLKNIDLRVMVKNNKTVTWGNLIEAIMRTSVVKLAGVEIIEEMTLDADGEKLLVEVTWHGLEKLEDYVALYNI